MAPLTLLLMLLGLAALLGVALVGRRGARRKRAVGRLLDAADALEARLRAARSELGANPGQNDPMREALQEMLRQRMWLQRHEQDASLRQLHEVRRSLEDARDRMDRQLQQVRNARAAA